jgi:hypothetical protein
LEPSAYSAPLSHLSVSVSLSRLQGVLFALAAVLAPLMGMTIDYIGHRPALIVTASLVLLLSHTLIMFGFGSPLIPLLLIGTAYSYALPTFIISLSLSLSLTLSLFAAVIWPIIPLLVDGYLQGVAFGVMVSGQNFAQCLIPAVVSYILMESEVYFHDSTHQTPSPSKAPSITRMIAISQCELLFALLSLCGAVAGAWLWYLDEYPPNNAPRGVLRATTKFSFEEVEKRARYNPTNVKPVTYGGGGEESSSSSTNSSSAIRDGEGEGLVMMTLRLDHSRASNTPEEREVEGEGDLEEGKGSSRQLDRSDWILYDLQAEDTPATELTPLVSSCSSVSSPPRNYQSTRPENETSHPTLVPTGLMPSRQPSILRHFSVYSPSQAGPHGEGHIQKATSFRGDSSFPERLSGSGQHPLVPLSAEALERKKALERRNSFNINKRRFTHF